LKKGLAEQARPYLKSTYPALKEQAEKLIAEVGGQGVLSPAELFLLPER
jgi:hypothetical protein